jgi:hypothetical protein
VIDWVLDVMLAIGAVDVEVRATEVVVEVDEDEVAATWAATSRISKMPARARARRITMLIPVNAITFVFILKLAYKAINIFHR